MGSRGIVPAQHAQKIRRMPDARVRRDRRMAMAPASNAGDKHRHGRDRENVMPGRVRIGERGEKQPQRFDG